MVRSLISALALAGAMMISGSAMAQTMVGGASVSADDLPKVQAACDTLAAKEQVDDSASASTSTESSTDATSGETDAGIDATTTTSIDLALLTYESCKEAGLVK
jgi:hypothetical protein